MPQKSNRYRFYRVHKFVTQELYEFDMLIAKTDFSTDAGIELIQSRLNEMIELLESHAEFEETGIHALLEQKGSSAHKQIEAEHAKHPEQFAQLTQMLADIQENKSDRIQRGHDFYLAYRLFLCETLKHLYDEETVLQKELEKLYTDDELKALEFNTYSKMAPEHMVQMSQAIFPHMNPDDRATFIKHMQEAEPDKYEQARSEIEKLIT